MDTAARLPPPDMTAILPNLAGNFINTGRAGIRPLRTAPPAG